MSLMLHFLLGLVVSFIAALPMGPVNLSVIQSSLRHGPRAALWVGSGGALMEAIYCSIGVWGIRFVNDNQDILLGVLILSIPVLIWLGIANLRKKTAPAYLPHDALDGEEVEEKPLQKARAATGITGFWVGFSLNFLNPLLVPFWFLSTTWFRSNGWIENDIRLLSSFVLGVLIGTLILFTLVAQFAARQRRIMTSGTLSTVYRVIGVLFLLLAVLQLYQLGQHFFGPEGGQLFNLGQGEGKLFHF